MDDLPVADVYVLGEIHDVAQHHVNQARAVAAVRPRAVVWEMLDAAQAGAVVPGASVEDLDRAIGWSGRGWPELALYHPIFQAAAGARHFGADVARGDLRRAMEAGAAAVIGTGFGLEAALAPDDQAAREAEQDEAHCGALPAEMLPGMVEAQRLRDAAPARAVLEAVATVGPPVVVITGSGHARKDTGVPAVLRAAAPDLRVLSVGQLEGDTDTAPFDLWLVTPPVAREDPCAAFAG